MIAECVLHAGERRRVQASDARSGRAAGTRRPAIGGRAARASVKEKRRRADCSVPCEAVQAALNHSRVAKTSRRPVTADRSRVLHVRGRGEWQRPSKTQRGPGPNAQPLLRNATAAVGQIRSVMKRTIGAECSFRVNPALALGERGGRSLCRIRPSGGWQERALRAGELFGPGNSATRPARRGEKSTAGSIS